MDPFWQWGISLIIAIQTIHGPALDAVFRGISFLGEEEFYLLLFPTLLWCVDTRLGFRIGLIFLLSVYVNSLVKETVAHPRPFELEPSVQLGDAQGYGLPSGHAQNAAIIWGGIAAQARRRWVWVAAIVLAGAIGFSRVYLGVHFPTDVLAGWAIGAVLLTVWLGGYSGAGRRIRRWPLAMQIALAAAVPAALALLFPDPGAVSATGAMAGVGAGYAVSVRYLAVGADGPWWQRVLRFVVGAAVLAALYLGLRLILPGQEAALGLVIRFARYAALGLWISLGAPWLFGVLHLGPRRAPRSPIAEPAHR